MVDVAADHDNLTLDPCKKYDIMLDTKTEVLHQRIVYVPHRTLYTIRYGCPTIYFPYECVLQVETIRQLLCGRYSDIQQNWMRTPPPALNPYWEISQGHNFFLTDFCPENLLTKPVQRLKDNPLSKVRRLRVVTIQVIQLSNN